MKERAPRNQTLIITDKDREQLRPAIVTIQQLQTSLFQEQNNIINADLLEALPHLPDQFADLIILDPPYNLSRTFDGKRFGARTQDSYEAYLRTWFHLICQKLKPTGSLYLCGDWKCTATLQRILDEELTIMNRITWQREKGRGALNNWKNGMEDIWFAVANPNDYYFNVEAVKMKRRVIAPYMKDGKPKDWNDTEDGKFRLTYPSNFWDDISIPFWSMPENTDHPTQKPEKLIAKLILASSRPGDIVFDPFLGSGTTAVVAKKLGRQYCGIEISELYCLYALKRLMMAEESPTIQGYEDGVFWERNSGK